MSEISLIETIVIKQSRGSLSDLNLIGNFIMLKVSCQYSIMEITLVEALSGTVHGILISVLCG